MLGHVATLTLTEGTITWQASKLQVSLWHCTVALACADQVISNGDIVDNLSAK